MGLLKGFRDLIEGHLQLFNLLPITLSKPQGKSFAMAWLRRGKPKVQWLI